MSTSSELIHLDPADRRSLQLAKNLLENPGLVAQLTNLVGTPLEALFKKLPKSFNKRLNTALESALTTSARWAQKSMGEDIEEAWNKSHMASVAVTGGVAGFVGPWAMLLEVPVTTTLIFRSIADIARSEGEPLKSAACIEECIKVFALGGPSKGDDATESGYYTVRASLALEVQLSASYLSKQMEKAAADAALKGAKAAVEKAPPLLVRLIQKVAERLGLTYSEKAAAQLVPIIGAVGGMTVNVVFMEHFQSMARGHFIVRRLERKYGEKAIKAVYDSLPRFEELPTPSKPAVEATLTE